MNSMRSIVSMSSTAVLCLVCGTLAVLWPGWRTTLRAHSYYQEGGCMTGGGTIGTTRVSHGFVLHCEADKRPNNLEVNWGRGNKFRLEQLTSASCSNDPNLPNPRQGGFNTYDGTGSGRYNGKPASAEWTFTDAGEPGSGDFADIVITDANGNVLSASGILSEGNHQAHRRGCEGEQHDRDGDDRGDDRHDEDRGEGKGSDHRRLEH